MKQQSHAIAIVPTIAQLYIVAMQAINKVIIYKLFVMQELQGLM